VTFGPALTRRRFLGTGAAAAAGFLARPVPLAAAAARGVTPAGELRDRIELSRARLAGTGVPAFTDAFVLADVVLDPRNPRRFSNFSGDLSGRFIGALATVGGAEERKRASALVAEALRHQRADGRFGAPDLAFTAEAISNAHMALLWGNGRLLVGLMEAHAAAPSPALLDGARRLGDFLIGVRDASSRPEVQARLVGQGAFGFICFTQLIEGFVLLAAATKDERYLTAARRVAPLLPARGIQHSHGYLTTLRGVLALHEATRDPALLAFVEERYRSLVESKDQTVYGAPLEYFGWESPEVSEADRAVLLRESGKDPRSEGCTEADFLRLSLGLWRVTGRSDYLQRAERCLRNSFFANQFGTGDFGHHAFFPLGVKPTDNVARAWWCCTMHGYRAFADVMPALLRRDGTVVRVDLGLDADWADDRLSLSLRERVDGLDLAVGHSSSLREELAIRLPDGADEPIVRVNGATARDTSSDGYVHVRRQWARGDRIEVRWTLKTLLVTRDGRSLDLDAGPDGGEAALFHGPLLMGVYEASEPSFFGEPWPGNALLVGARVDPGHEAAGAGASERFTRPDTHLTFAYRHEGFSGMHPVTLRPFSEQTALGPTIVATWLRFDRAARR